MKKLFFIFVLALLSSVIFAQKKSNYEKYWQAREDSINKSTASITTAKPEYDDLYYQPSKDAKKVKKNKRTDVQEIVDTLVNENPDIQVNYVYNYDPYFYSYNIGRFYHGGFNYWMYSNSWYYSNWMYDPYDFYWDMRFGGYPYWNYNSYYLGFYGYNYWSPWRNYNHYGFNNYNHNNYYSHNGNNWNTSNRRSNGMNPMHYKTQTSSVQNRRPAENRAYSPSYNQPRMNTRPQYNNSKVGDVTNRRANVSTQSRTYSQPNRSESRTQSRTYTAPTRSYNESRSYNNGGSDRRSSGSYSGGSSYSAPRSSGSSNFSSSSRSSGGSSYSSGGSSSGGRSSGGGRR